MELYIFQGYDCMAVADEKEEGALTQLGGLYIMLSFQGCSEIDVYMNML